MQKGFKELSWSEGKNWFYFGSDGAMKFGWQKLTRNGKTN